MSTFPASTIKDIAESVGIPNLKDDVAASLAQDVEYRIHEIVQEAMKFMRHGKRTKLTVDDINNALRVRNVEPLYGFSAAEPTKFRRTTAGTGATGTSEIFFVEDEELDFETILSAPLPKVPLDVTYTAHWLAIEGVQPAIPQNPTPSDAKTDLLNKRIKLDPTTQPVIPGIKPGSSSAGNASTSNNNSGDAEIKPLVKHVLSKELQMYYERISSAVLSQDEVLRATGISSLQNDPGLHQLLPYFVQLVAEKVTQNTRNLPVLIAMMSMVRALLENDSLFIEPYLHQLMPTILTCVVGKRLGEPSLSSPTSPPQDDHWGLRSTATDIILLICQKYGSSYHTLQPRVTRTLLRAFLDPEKPLTTHYGAILGLTRMGNEVFKTLVVPNLKTYSSVIEPELGLDSQDDDNLMEIEHHLDGLAAIRRNEAAHCLEALLIGLRALIKSEAAKAKNTTQAQPTLEDVREPFAQAIGELLARSVLSEDGIEQHLQGVVVVIESC
ncbi:transcription initiation factor TFIID complex 60 kDa subunit [Mortierella sp. GBAus27b]|nr:transcription initiation factor TFIID complex 60 kDa subunit [Mortierella sp. GBAus27b]